MSEDVVIDPTANIINLAYTGVENINLSVPTEFVKALVLSGNVMSDFSFFQFLPLLQVFHGDSMQLDGFEHIATDLLPKLTHMILRNNNFNTFDSLLASDSLQHLDVSLNNFVRGAEQSLSQSYPALKVLLFG